MALQRIALSVSEKLFEFPNRVRKINLVFYIVHTRICGTFHPSPLPPPSPPANGLATPFYMSTLLWLHNTALFFALHEFARQACINTSISYLILHPGMHTIVMYCGLENCSLIYYLVHSFGMFYNYYFQRRAARLSPLCYTVHLLRQTLLSYYTCSLSFVSNNSCPSS